MVAGGCSPRCSVMQRIEGCFEAVVSSDEVRAYKPHPDFYRAAVKRLGLQPAEFFGVFERVRSGGRETFRIADLAHRTAVTRGSPRRCYRRADDLLGPGAGGPALADGRLCGAARFRHRQSWRHRGSPSDDPRRGQRCLCLMVGFAKWADRPCTKPPDPVNAMRSSQLSEITMER